MLTEIQKARLDFLVEIPKYGKILNDTIKIWNLNNITPTRGSYGLGISIFSKTYCIDEYNKCCLLGGALVGKSPCNDIALGNIGFIESFRTYFDISRKEFHDLHFGFDERENLNNLALISNEKTPAYNFGKSVNEILFEK